MALGYPHVLAAPLPAKHFGRERIVSDAHGRLRLLLVEPRHQHIGALFLRQFQRLLQGERAHFGKSRKRREQNKDGSM